MAIYVTDAKTIDELQELGKLSGTEKLIISNGVESKKVSVDTLVGYTAGRMNNVPKATSGGAMGYGAQSIVFVPEGEEVPVYERTPGCFYLEETKQTSIRTRVNTPTSVVVSKNLGLRRV
jgi:hypothetical protein